jgi:hypothetical protein
MRIGVTGGRDFNDRAMVERSFDKYVTTDDIIIEGEALGADSLCRDVAQERGVTVEKHPANWGGPCAPECPPNHRRKNKIDSHHGGSNDYCPAAGPRRNREMLESGLDLLLAFPGGTGTQNMIDICKAAGVKGVRFS